MYESSRGRFDRRAGHRRRDREHGEGSRQQRKAGSVASGVAGRTTMLAMSGSAPTSDEQGLAWSALQRATCAMRQEISAFALSTFTMDQAGLDPSRCRTGSS
ncbi:hypothetical protein LRK24_10275 [Rhodanobacter denitrificans]|uniref:hypothetical protein n=1 Tax=Rhodanobacter denitrificans TaxID=666685 RepID=UPI000ABC41CD|nr:hypothetical protein [Rhodanobacter denitrificans]UJM88848.1 hypothetical protein LRK24_10275 [Rhodanobacter denitrificans]